MVVVVVLICSTQPAKGELLYYSEASRCVVFPVP